MCSYGRHCPSISLKRKIKLRPAHSSKSTTGPWVNNRISDNNKKKREDVARPRLNQTKFQTPGIRGFPSLTMGSPVKEAWLVWHSLSLPPFLCWRPLEDCAWCHHRRSGSHSNAMYQSTGPMPNLRHQFFPPCCMLSSRFPFTSHLPVHAGPSTFVPYGLIHRPLCCGGGGMKKGMHYGQCCKYKKEAK